LNGFKFIDESGMGNEAIYYAMGICSDGLGNYADAENYYLAAISKAGENGNPEYYRQLAWLYDEILERPNDAIRMYSQYIKHSRESANTAAIRIDLARLYHGSGQFQQAIEQVKKLDPYMKQLDPATRTKAYYYTALSEWKLNHFDVAFNAFRFGINEDSGFPEIHRQYGNFLDQESLRFVDKSKQRPLLEEALNQFKTYLEKVPDSPRRAEVLNNIESLRERIK
jgi:tetratricopeptide (TPR) repeat protein